MGTDQNSNSSKVFPGLGYPQELRKTEVDSDHNTIYLNFRCSRAANSLVCGGLWLKFEPIQAFIAVLVSCKNEEDPFKNEGTRVVTTFLPL